MRWHHRFALVLPLLLFPLLLAADDKPASDAGGFVPLFNEKDLTGWVRVNTAPGTFFVKDGMIVTTGKPNGFLRTEKMYENFVFEMEWKHIVPKGNSGLFIWADALPAVGTPFTRSIEVQVLDGTETKDYTSHGDVFSIWGAKMKPDRPHPSGWERCLPSEKRSKPAGQWNHYRVECNNGVLKLAVNGKVVSGASACSPRKGHIALEAEGTECHFRNLKIKELPGTGATKKETATVGQGHVTLFTGLDLSGWKMAEGQKKHWSVLSGPNVLRYDGKASTSGLVWTEKPYADFELVCDYRLRDKKGSASVLLRGPDGARLALPARAEGRWTRFIVRVRGDRVAVEVDGRPVEMKDRPEKLPASGPIGLAASQPVDFMNLFVRELK